MAAYGYVSLSPALYALKFLIPHSPIACSPPHFGKSINERLHKQLVVSVRFQIAMLTMHMAWLADSEQCEREVKDQPAEATAGETAALAGEAPPHAPQACLCADWQCSSLHVLPAAATMPAAPVPGQS